MSTESGEVRTGRFRGAALRSPPRLAPAALLPPFWATGLFLYQTAIADPKGWTVLALDGPRVPFAFMALVGLALEDSAGRGQESRPQTHFRYRP
ncbi:MAG: hypothetical protein ACOC8K_03950 [Gemmatimonadota bacterium]